MSQIINQIFRLDRHKMGQYISNIVEYLCHKERKGLEKETRQLFFKLITK